MREARDLAVQRRATADAWVAARLKEASIFARANTQARRSLAFETVFSAADKPQFVQVCSPLASCAYSSSAPIGQNRDPGVLFRVSRHDRIFAQAHGEGPGDTTANRIPEMNDPACTMR